MLKFDNVIVYRTFSKAMALPSIRCGYALSNKENIEMIPVQMTPTGPDMDEVELDKAIAKKFGIDPECVTSGVGSDELLDATFRAILEPGDEILGFTPSFSMYKIFAELTGAKYIPVLLTMEVERREVCLECLLMNLLEH